MPGAARQTPARSPAMGVPRSATVGTHFAVMQGHTCFSRHHVAHKEYADLDTASKTSVHQGKRDVRLARSGDIMGMRLASLAFTDSLIETYGEGPMALFFISVTVCLGIIASNMLKGLLESRLADKQVSGLSLIINISRIVIALIVVYFLCENVFHIEMGGVIQALGITTLVVSLGLQDLIKSVVAGLLIVAGSIVSVGDQIVMDDHRGEVMDINWHQITIRDRDGVVHIIPHSTLMSNTFLRMSGKMAYRHMFECQIAPGVNLALVKTDIETLAASTLTKHGWIAPGYPPQVLFLGSTAFGTTASIRIFINDIEYATRAMDAVTCAISTRGYLADCTHEVNPNWKPASQAS